MSCCSCTLTEHWTVRLLESENTRTMIKVGRSVRGYDELWGRLGHLTELHSLSLVRTQQIGNVIGTHDHGAQCFDTAMTACRACRRQHRGQLEWWGGEKSGTCTAIVGETRGAVAR